ncbi:pilus assembly protein [Arthrobacter agilis]|uniref:TadE/TadG family type IV pilus assembly protein n=1 Tax=Arthrobacter agilis TaxID=37921 RepID=UPI000B351BE3|nr:TadE/TadG family type IV pilus assembly protein [Arthrobacter agilis]OUM44247.1 pilus assembly protein TadE [Arthrobacter agilis]PPB46621.1 pilus assembly protein [Arthrobacter agilis]TPV23940.1 pilus assembly protein [Arthrobacter agilis]
MLCRTHRHDGERGAAVVDFALVGGLLTVVFIAILQLTLVLHVRNTLIDAASSGARYGTLADRSPDDAVTRARTLIEGSLADSYGSDITVAQSTVGGVETLEVIVRAPLPVIGLVGPAGVMEVRGHAALPS